VALYVLAALSWVDHPFPVVLSWFVLPVFQATQQVTKLIALQLNSYRQCNYFLNLSPAGLHISLELLPILTWFILHF